MQRPFLVRARDPELEAVVPRRANVQEGDVCPVQKLGGIAGNVVRGHDAPGAVADPAIGSLAFHKVVRARSKYWRKTVTGPRLAGVLAKKDRPCLGIRLRIGERAIGEHHHAFAIRNEVETMSAGVSRAVGKDALGRLTIGHPSRRRSAASGRDRSAGVDSGWRASGAPSAVIHHESRSTGHPISRRSLPTTWPCRSTDTAALLSIANRTEADDDGDIRSRCRAPPSRRECRA